MSIRFVIDASVTMSWCFADERGELAQQTLQALTDGEAVVPAIWTLEVANVLLMAKRRNRLTRAESEQFIALLEALPITVESGNIRAISSRILALGRDYNLSSYDAAYLEGYGSCERYYSTASSTTGSKVSRRLATDVRRRRNRKLPVVNTKPPEQGSSRRGFVGRCNAFHPLSLPTIIVGCWYCTLHPLP